MKGMISFGVLGWTVALIFAVILVAVLYYYLAKVNPHNCKNACMTNCRTCRRNCVSHDSAVKVEERFKDSKAMSEIIKVM